MRAESRIAAAALAGAGLALALWSLLPNRTQDGRPPARPVTIRTSFAPPAAGFADEVVARVVVVLDRRAVRLSTLRVQVDLAPLSLTGPRRETRVTRGRTTIVRIETPAACLSERCLAPSGTRSVAPAPVRAEVRRADGPLVSTDMPWTPLQIAGRVAPTVAAAATPTFLADTAPPSVTYSADPTRLALVFDLAGAALVGAGSALAAAATLSRGRRRRCEGMREPLEQAIALARAARSRPAPDRRSALGLLARLLARRDPALARTAADLAWSRPPPGPDALERVVDAVEREVRA